MYLAFLFIFEVLQYQSAFRNSQVAYYVNIRTYGSRTAYSERPATLLQK